MLHIFDGQNPFTKRLHLGAIGQPGIEVAYYDTDTDGLALGDWLAADLFTSKKIVVLKGAALALLQNWDDHQVALEKSPYEIVLYEPAFERKINLKKQIKSLPFVVWYECPVPEMNQLSAWVVSHAQSQNITIKPPASQGLIKLLVGEAAGFGGPVVTGDTLHYIHSELQKFHAHSNGQEITLELIQQLGIKNAELIIWDLVRAFEQKNKLRFFSLFEQFLNQPDGVDEKGKIIQLASMIAEQLRAMLLIKTARGENSLIIDQLGWKSTRIQMVARSAGGFSEQGIKEVLNKLEQLDVEVKSGGLPPRTLFTLICTQALA